jgi:hypothetical protein
MGRMVVEKLVFVLGVDGCGQGEALQKKRGASAPRFQVVRRNRRDEWCLWCDVAHSVESVGQIAELRVDVGGGCALGGEGGGQGGPTAGLAVRGEGC